MRIDCAISPCPNDVYIFGGLLLDKIVTDELEFEFSFADIQKLNEIASQRKADVVKISAANLNHIPNSYELLSCGGALGNNCGPLLLNHPSQEINKIEPVMIPGENTTAHFLFNYYVNKSVAKTFLPYDELYKRLKDNPGSRGVVIHESRFIYQKDGLQLEKDLGQYWEQETSYPIPLGVVVCGKDQITQKKISELIRKSIRWSQENKSEILDLCKKYSQELDEDVIQSHIDLYVNGFSYDIGVEGRKAIDFLLRNSTINSH